MTCNLYGSMMFLADKFESVLVYIPNFVCAC